MENPLKAVSDVLRTGESFLVTAHYGPDGDALGSTAAMGHLLAALGKPFTLYNVSGLPPRYDWVTLPAPLTSELPEAMPQWTIALDCGADHRLGTPLLARLQETRLVNIDHHLGNAKFGEVNWVDKTQPAVGAMVALLAKELDIPLTGPLAECVYLAVATDTGFFSYGSTTPESLELAADMLRNGLDLPTVNMHITKQWSVPAMRLWTEIMAGVETFHDGTVAVATVTRDMYQHTGTTSTDTEDVINFLRSLRTVRAAILLREEGEDQYKFSLRSSGNDNIQAVASRFNGGGHKNASGGSIQAPLDEAKTMLVAAVADELGLH